MYCERSMFQTVVPIELLAENTERPVSGLRRSGADPAGPRGALGGLQVAPWVKPMGKYYNDL